jgi:hypothetical protein
MLALPIPACFPPRPEIKSSISGFLRAGEEKLRRGRDPLLTHGSGRALRNQKEPKMGLIIALVIIAVVAVIGVYVVANRKKPQ